MVKIYVSLSKNNYKNIDAFNADWQALGEAAKKVITAQNEVDGFKDRPDYFIISPYTPAENDGKIYALAMCVAKMGGADVVAFKGDEWQKTRGCRFEHDIAVAYGKRVVYL